MEDYPNPNSVAYAENPHRNAHLATNGTVQKVLNDIADAVQTLLARSKKPVEQQRAIVSAFEEWRHHMLRLFEKKPRARVVKGWGVWTGYCVSVELNKLLDELRGPALQADPEFAVTLLDLGTPLNRSTVNDISKANSSSSNAMLNASSNIPEYFGIPEVHIIEHERHVKREPSVEEGWHNERRVKEEPHREQGMPDEREPYIKQESPEAESLYAIPPHPSQQRSIGHHVLLNRFSLRQQRLYRL